MKKFSIYWLPLIAYCLAIFIQSSLALPEELEYWPVSDKLQHLGAYTLLGILFYRALGTLPRAEGGPGHIWAAIIATGLYGISDEFHQAFVPERTADILDALMDLLGGVLGVMLYRWRVSFLKRRNLHTVTLTSPSGSDNNP